MLASDFRISTGLCLCVKEAIERVQLSFHFLEHLFHVAILCCSTENMYAPRRGAKKEVK
ncbi:MAG: hypothetical protein KAU16_01060 [Methanophagales archaeon]|nr:hypothetical protein [Methanophagales archaeon]